MKPGTLLLALFLNTALLPAQQQPGNVTGKVVNSVTGQPVKRAVVMLRTADGGKSYVTGSDASGKFSFDNIQPASYVASGQADGYADFQRTSGKPVAVAAQQTVEDVEVRIAPLAVITGKVLDEDGQPLANVNVNAMRFVYTAMGKRLQVVSAGQTDDRGIYRMHDVQPGRYYLRAFTFGNMPNERGANVHSTIPEEAFAPMFYPGVGELSQASPQGVQPGAELTADFKLRRLPAYHIRGRVSGVASPDGGRGRASNVSAQRCEPGDDAVSMLQADVRVIQEANGRFDAAGAINGTYCLGVMQPPAGSIAARQTVTVKSADVDGIELAAAPSFAVNGTVTIDGTAPNPMPPINIGLSSASTMGMIRGVMKSDGTFRVEGALPGAYSVVMLQRGPVYIKSILYGGQDVTNGMIPNLQAETPLTITMGTDPGEIDGTVQPGNVDAGIPITIAALPEDAYAARQDMQHIAGGSTGGSFSMTNMPPGNYKVFAVQSENFDDVYNRDLMKLLEGKATAVTVHAAGHEQVSVTAIPIGEVEQAREKLK